MRTVRSRAPRGEVPSPEPHERGARSGSSRPRSTPRTSGHRQVRPPARRSGRSRSHRCHAATSRSGRGRHRARTAALRRGSPGRARTHIAHRGAPRASPSSAASSLALLSASVASSPAYRRVRTPGAPSSASTSMPESSARVGSPVTAIPARALIAAFASNVSPSSIGSSSTPSWSSDTSSACSSASSSRSSRSLCSLRVAISRRPSVTAGPWRAPRPGPRTAGPAPRRRDRASTWPTRGRTAALPPCPAARRRSRRRWRRR